MTGGWNDDCDQMRERTAGFESSAAEKTAQGANAHSENTDHQRTLHITPHVILPAPGCLSAASHVTALTRLRRGTTSALHFEIFRRCFPSVCALFVFHRLPFIQTGQAGPFEGGDMDEHVLPAALRLDETVPFLRIKP